MVKSISALLAALFITTSIVVKAQNISKSELDSIHTEVETLLGDDWFLTPTKSGFIVTFCRSCHQEYIDSFNLSFEKVRFEFREPRNDFFSFNRADTVWYYPTCCHLVPDLNESDSARHSENRKKYQANGILSFEIIFERKWDTNKYNATYEKNQLLKEEILKEPIYKTDMRIFSDYRFWLPADYLKERTKKFNYYFIRLPYSSETLPASIFIIPDKPYFGCEPIYVNKCDPEYYKNELNYIEPEWRRTLKIIALALGIQDYHIVD